MNYELAKQLKEAGFPQKESIGFSGIIPILAGADKASYFPSLEELIEACGDSKHVFSIDIFPSGKCYATREGLVLENNQFTMSIQDEGKTPSEALANLWVVLNKK